VRDSLLLNGRGRIKAHRVEPFHDGGV
jgi:hypothetical protein